MADKQTVLSIVLRTVDNATAGINAFNKRVEKATKPLTDFKKAAKELRETVGENLGLNAVAGGFKDVGGAVQDLFGKIAIGTGIVAAATAAVLHMVGEFDDLGDKADRLGVTVDFLASMEFAAERSGAEVQQLDDGMQAFLANVGAAKANKGSLFKFLSVVSPDLLKQIKLAKSGEQAFRIFADGVAAITDQEKKLALAEKAGLGAALVPLLSRGSSGLVELQGEFAGTAGSLEEAAARAGEVDDSLKNLKAATTGVKAALVAGLGPALKEIIDKLKDWLVGHKDDIAQWAVKIGEELPGAVAKLADKVKDVAGDVLGFVDAIGGWKVAAGLVAAVIAGPLIASLVSLSVALVSTPAGWVVLALTAIVAAITVLITKWNSASTGWKIAVDVILFVMNPFLALPLIIYRHWGGIKEFFGGVWDWVTDKFSKAWDYIKPIVDKIIGAAKAVKSAVEFVVGSQDEQHANALAVAASEGITIDTTPTVGGKLALPPAPGSSTAKISIDITGAPRGTRVTADPRNTADIDLTTGYNMGGAW